MAKLNKEQEQAIIASDRMRDEMNKMGIDSITAPMVETEPQTLLSKKELKSHDAPVIKPSKSMPSAGKPLEKEKQIREEGWQYVKCIAENNEVVGEMIEFWLKIYSGDPIHFWQVPTNKPIYLPKHVAEHLASRTYHVMTMKDKPLHEQYHGEVTHTLMATETRRRLDCRSVQFGF